VRLARRILLLSAGAVVLVGATSAQGDATVSGPLHGNLLGVGPDQGSLIVGWDESDAPGCGVVNGSVTPSVIETAESVTVTLTAEAYANPPNTVCPLPAGFGTITVALAAPLGGREITGLGIQGGGYGQGSAPPIRIPNLVGLSPVDSRLMMSSPRGIPAGQSFSGVGPVGLVDHHTHVSRGALAMVVAQRPRVGEPIRRHITVVLTVAP
jgi:hypothetical protein